MPQHQHVEILDGGPGLTLEWWFQSLRNRTGDCVPTTGGSHRSASPGISMPGSWRVHPLVKPQMQEERMWFLSWLWNSGSLSSQQYLRVHGSLSNQCTFVDLEKLFIRIPHSILWGMLQEYRVLACCWVIQSVYNCVQFLGGASWWKAFTLVATGSPLLFADDEVPANLDQGRVAPPTGGV